MSRISDPSNIPAPAGTGASESVNSARATSQPVRSTSVQELFHVIVSHLAPSPDRAINPQAMSEAVIDWWMHHNLPARLQQEPLKKQLREQLVDVLKDDPSFQALVEKVYREMQR